MTFSGLILIIRCGPGIMKVIGKTKIPDSFNKDTIYDSPQAQISHFSFDEKVASVFADMINRSVPGYATVISLIGVLAAEYAQPKTLCYDLGCSLGAVTLAMRNSIPHDDCTIIAVDNSQAMISLCRNIISQERGRLPVEIVCDDIRNVAIKNASVVVLNYTLQFIAPECRLPLLKRIFTGMVEGGVLILSEKLAFSDNRQSKEFENLHQKFKLMNGYSQLEISQKRTAIDNILIRDTINDHMKRLTQAGFSNSSIWFQCLNFSSLIAHKKHV